MARDLASDSGADLSKTGDDVREALKNGRAALLRGRMESRHLGGDTTAASHGGARRPAEPPAIRRSGESAASPNGDTPTHTQTTNPYPLPPKNAILSPFLEPKEKQGIDQTP